MRTSESEKRREVLKLFFFGPHSPYLLLNGDGSYDFQGLSGHGLLLLCGLWPPDPGAVLWFLLPSAGDCWWHLRKTTSNFSFSFPCFSKMSNTIQSTLHNSFHLSSAQLSNTCLSDNNIFSVHIIDKKLETRKHKEFITIITQQSHS